MDEQYVAPLDAVDNGGFIKVSGTCYALREMDSGDLQALHLAIADEAARIRKQLEAFLVEQEMAAGALPFERLDWRTRARHALSVKKQQMTAIHAEFARRKTLTPPLAEYAFTAVYEVYGPEGLAQVQEVARGLLDADLGKRLLRGKPVSRQGKDRARVCGEKVGYTCEADAQVQVERMKEDGADVRALQIYRCPWCHLLHIGNNKRKKRRFAERARKKEV